MTHFAPHIRATLSAHIFRITLCVILLLAVLLPSLAQARTSPIINSITREAVEETITDALKQAGAGDDIAITWRKAPARLLYQSHQKLFMDLGSLDYDPTRKSWKATLSIRSQGAELRSLSLAGNYELMQEVPVLLQRMKRGDIITEAQIGWKKLPSAKKHSDTISDIDALVGMALKRSIAADTPIRSSFIAAPILIKRGASVEMYYKTPYMEIRTTGEALEDGAKHALIRVKNLNSETIVRAKVIDSNTVSVSGSRL